MQGISQFGGADILLTTKDNKYLISCSTYSDIFHVRKMSDVLSQVGGPSDAVSLYAEKQLVNNKIMLKKTAKSNDNIFFKELLDESDDSNDDSSEEEKIESEDDENGDGENNVLSDELDEATDDEMDRDDEDSDTSEA